MKIAVYAICKNEEAHVQRWLESVAQADEIVLVDTGSTDATLEVLEKLSVDYPNLRVHQICISPWRFDDARNVALALVSTDVDMCIALDLDDVIVGDWKATIQSFGPEVNRIRSKYVWSHTADGADGLTYWAERIHGRHNHRWRNPTHEIVECMGERVDRFTEDFVIHHWPDHSKPRPNLDLLELSVKERPDDKRSLWYLGREYYFQNRKQESIATFLKYLEIGTWEAERSAAYRLIGNQTQEEKWFLRAAAEAPGFREPWVSLAMWHEARQNWMEALCYAMRALKIEERPKEYFCEEYAWGQIPFAIVQRAIAALNG